MTSYPQGGVAGLQAQFLDHPSGDPADPTSITLTISNAVATVVGGPYAYPGTIQRTGLGLFYFPWPVPEALPLGDYTAKWQADLAGVSRTGYETFTVTAGAGVITGTPSWASVQDVLTYTGATVTGDLLTRAQATVDLAAGRTYSAATHTGARDAYWMKLAVSYQAAWMLAQLDLFARVDYTEIETLRTPLRMTETAMTLAPLTRIALRRVSWLKTRSLHVKAPFQDGQGPLSSDPLSSANDAYLNWAAL